MAEHATFHEPVELLSQAIMERHRAIVSLMEELEAVDWYDQRVEASSDSALASVMAHNRDEEKEHAAMTLEWLRRNDAKWDEVLRTYLFTDAADRRGRARGRSRRWRQLGAIRRIAVDRRPEKGTPAMNHLLRELAPVPSAAWEQIDEEATRTLRHFLAARRLVDIDGPARMDQGVRHAGPRRRRERRAGRHPGTAAFGAAAARVPRRVLDGARRARRDRPGALDADLDPARDAARRLALAEDGAVFQGHRGGLIDGIAEASPHDEDPDQRRLPRLPERGRTRGRDAADVGRRRSVLGCPRTALLHRRRGDHRDGWLPGARAPAADQRWARAVGARRRRRGRAVDTAAATSS